MKPDGSLTAGEAADTLLGGVLIMPDEWSMQFRRDENGVGHTEYSEDFPPELSYQAHRTVLLAGPIVAALHGTGSRMWIENLRDGALRIHVAAEGDAVELLERHAVEVLAQIRGTSSLARALVCVGMWLRMNWRHGNRVLYTTREAAAEMRQLYPGGLPP